MKCRFAAILVALALQLLVVHKGWCSNIKVTNPQHGALSGGSTTVTFDITWTNSWRTTGVGAPAPNNWDATWVFVKYRKNGGNWSHASLNEVGHSMGSGTAATYSVGYPDTSASFNIATNPGVGLFIYRSGDGTGTFTLTGTSLSWNYGQDGVADSDTVEIRVFAIEMVYIPTGSFFAGDNATSAFAFKQGESDSDPWYIGSEAAFTTGNQQGSGTGVGETNAEYYYPSVGSSGEDIAGATFTIPAEFPKGYQAFYMMKGEISQGQWVSFFNTLTSAQKTSRNIVSTKGNSLTFRNNVQWTSGDATLPDQGDGATYEAVAANYLSWADLSAYLDWAGLRPMSELEFERAGRGPYRPVAGEFAWGSTSITGASSASLVKQGKLDEQAQSGANCIVSVAGSVQGPMRVAAMAYGKATRIESGAGYYGAMDLSGNVGERSVTVGNATGRALNGAKHGNGALTTSSPAGNADVSTWPGTNAVGSGFRGGHWAYSSSHLRLSARNLATGANTLRSNAIGGRGVRTAQ